MSSTYDVFCSYNARDQNTVLAVARGLQESGVSVFMDRWYLVGGRPWPVALEHLLGVCHSVAVFVGPGGLGSWQQKEVALALDRQTREADFRVIPVVLPGADPPLGFLRLNTWVDLALGDPAGLASLKAAIRGEPPGPPGDGPGTDVRVCPFRGLRPFREEDSLFFFGRDAFAGRLTKAVAWHSFVAVVGASGSGKSSVVHAGLVPRLRRGEDRRAWEVVTLVPHDDPLRSLAAALAPLLGDLSTASPNEHLATIDKLRARLVDNKGGLRDLAALALKRQTGTDRLLLVVDQWDELYTVCKDETVRRAFIDQILDAAARGTVTVVATLRADLTGHALSYRPLADALNEGYVGLGPMTRVELEQAVREPVEKVGLAFEPGLVNRLLNDVGDEPGNLPLLEFVLTELWEKRRGRRLCHEDYDAMGGVTGAMARRAEDAFLALPPPDRLALRRAFEKLVDSGTVDARRRAALQDLSGAERRTAQRLVEARLLVTSRDDATGLETVEVAHEALIHNWKRLREWLDEDRQARIVLARVQTRADEWAEKGRQPDRILRGAELDEALVWEQRQVMEDRVVPSLVQDFIRESRRVRTRRRMIRLGVTAVLLVGLFVLSFKLTDLGDEIHTASVRWAIDASLEAMPDLRTGLGRLVRREFYCTWFQPFHAGRIFYISDAKSGASGLLVRQTFLLSTDRARPSDPLRWYVAQETQPALRSRQDFLRLLDADKMDVIQRLGFPERPALDRASVEGMFWGPDGPGKGPLFEGGIARVYATYGLHRFFGLPYEALRQTTMVVGTYENGFVLAGAPVEHADDVQGIYVLVKDAADGAPVGRGYWLDQNRYPPLRDTFKTRCQRG